MKKVIKLTESDLIRIVKRIIKEERIITEDLAHKQRLYTSWANKRSGNPEAAMKIMDDVLNYQKKLPKKDFANYSSYDELVADINKIKGELKSQDATKLYEDSELVVLAPNTWEASCKYGAGSKWCTTAKDTSSYWERHNQTGTEFFWIFKNKPQSDPNYKFSYHIKMNGGADWCNAINTCTSNLPKDAYPLQHPRYEEIISKLKEFHDNRDYVKNYLTNKSSKDLLMNFIETGLESNFDEFVNMFKLKAALRDLIDDQVHFFDYESEIMNYTDDDEEIDIDMIDEIRRKTSKEIKSYEEDIMEETFDGLFINSLSVLFERVLAQQNIPLETFRTQQTELNFLNIASKIPDEEIVEIFIEESSLIVIEKITEIVMDLL